MTSNFNQVEYRLWTRLNNLVHRALMDFGFGKFLEMFEEHYGKRATKVLLGIISFAVLVFCLELIAKGLFLPLVSFLKDWGQPSTLDKFKEYLIPALFAFIYTAISTYLFLFLMQKFLFEPKHNELMQEAKSAVETAKSRIKEAEDAREKLAEMVKENPELKTKFDQLLKAMASGEPASQTLAKGSAASSEDADEDSSDTQIHAGKSGDTSGKRGRKSPDKRP